MQPRLPVSYSFDISELGRTAPVLYSSFDDNSALGYSWIKMLIFWRKPNCSEIWLGSEGPRPILVGNISPCYQRRTRMYLQNELNLTSFVLCLSCNRGYHKMM